MPNLEYTRALTDDTGMIQHGLGGIPDPATGYTTDDNARALLAMVRLWRAYPARRAEIEPLLRRYLGFLVWTQRRQGTSEGWFVNFVSYERQFLEERGSEDCLGRCIWALGEAASGPLPPGCELAVWTLLHRALPHVEGLRSPRACAYTLLGLTQALPQESDRLYALMEPLAQLWKGSQKTGWHWFEPYLTYDNARLVEAVWRGAWTLSESRYLTIARDATAFLTEHSFTNEYHLPVGSRGWWHRGSVKALFDQQTVEAGAYKELYTLLGEESHAQQAQGWFEGRNIHGLAVYDPQTGGCYDSLIESGVNRNQGAESTLSYLLSH